MQDTKIYAVDYRLMVFVAGYGQERDNEWCFTDGRPQRARARWVIKDFDGSVACDIIIPSLFYVLCFSDRFCQEWQVKNLLSGTWL